MAIERLQGTFFLEHRSDVVQRGRDRLPDASVDEQLMVGLTILAREPDSFWTWSQLFGDAVGRFGLTDNGEPPWPSQRMDPENLTDYVKTFSIHEAAVKMPTCKACKKAREDRLQKELAAKAALLHQKESNTLKVLSLYSGADLFTHAAEDGW